MYSKRAALKTFRYIWVLAEVRSTIAPDYSCSVSVCGFVSNLSTATERSNFDSVLDGYGAENHAVCGNFNEGDRFYSGNLGGFERKQNPSVVYGQSMNVKDDGFVGDGNSNCYGNGNGGILGMPLEPGNVGGSYSSTTWQNFHNTVSYQQHGADISYSNAVNYQQNSFQSQSHGLVDPQLHSGVNSTLESVHVVGESQSAVGRTEHLDEFIKDGKLKEAVKLLGQLLNEGVEVELPRYMSLMTACGEKQALDMAKSVHEHLLQSMPNLELRTYNWILEMYVKCGSMVDAFAVFDGMPQRNLTSWDIMISGLAAHGLGEDSIDLFGEFKRSGLKPDGQMFIGVFSACGVLCDIVEGMLHFESMTKDYGIHPTMEHYVGIVGMLGCAGCLDEALEFIENMPVEPAIDIWETLMKYSRIHGDVVLGDRCAEFVELLDPSRLNEQSRVGLIPVNPADLAREEEKKKLTGQNIAYGRSRVHEYSAGSTQKIYALLGGLRQQLKEAGYIPYTRVVLYDIDPECKEEALMAHDARLEAAQCFMASPARLPVRIINGFPICIDCHNASVRICIDCHNAFKIISKIVGREIALRDSRDDTWDALPDSSDSDSSDSDSSDMWDALPDRWYRWHHFRDGSCNCNDFW